MSCILPLIENQASRSEIYEQSSAMIVINLWTLDKDWLSSESRYIPTRLTYLPHLPPVRRVQYVPKCNLGQEQIWPISTVIKSISFYRMSTFDSAKFGSPSWMSGRRSGVSVELGIALTTGCRHSGSGNRVQSRQFASFFVLQCILGAPRPVVSRSYDKLGRPLHS
jgi:hypothetical protein